MKTLKNLLWSLLPLFCLTMVVSCGEDPTAGNNEPSGKDSKINLAQSTVNVGPAGGTQVLEYEIVNPKGNVKISAKAADTWVKDFSTSITGALAFEVEPNETGAVRKCLVTIEYPYAKPAIFTVIQASTVTAGFDVTFHPSLFGFTVDIYPEKKDVEYIIMSASAEYVIASEFETGEDFYNDDYAYFGWLGSFYGESAVDVMNTRAKIGDQIGVEVGKGAPGTPYIVYLYYFDTASGAMISDVDFNLVWTTTPVQQQVDFDMTCEPESCMIHADVTPVGYEGYYYFDAISKSYIDSYLTEFVDMDGKPYFKTPEEVVAYYWYNAVATMMYDGQLSAEAILRNYSCDGLNDDGTSRSHFDFELLAEHEYYVFAFTMDNYALCASTPKLQLVTTGRVEPSDNVITLSVPKITARTATISATTTNNDYYIAGWEEASKWSTFGDTPEEIQEHLLNTLVYEFLEGDFSMNVIGLKPETEYVFYAFGTRGGVPTTALSTCNFTTKAEGVGAATIELMDYGYFLADDLAQLEGFEEMFSGEKCVGNLIMPIEVKIEGPWDSFWVQGYIWIDRRWEEYDDNNYINGLIWSINEYGSMTLDKTYNIIEPDSELTYVALVIDTDGCTSPLLKRQINPTFDGARTDVEWFAEWWNDREEDDDLELQAKVSDYRPIFKQKSQAKKVSQLNLNIEQKVVAADENIVRR